MASKEILIMLTNLIEEVVAFVHLVSVRGCARTGLGTSTSLLGLRSESFVIDLLVKNYLSN